MVINAAAYSLQSARQQPRKVGRRLPELVEGSEGTRGTRLLGWVMLLMHAGCCDWGCGERYGLQTLLHKK